MSSSAGAEEDRDRPGRWRQAQPSAFASRAEAHQGAGGGGMSDRQPAAFSLKIIVFRPIQIATCGGVRRAELPPDEAGHRQQRVRPPGNTHPAAVSRMAVSCHSRTGGPEPPMPENWLRCATGKTVQGGSGRHLLWSWACCCNSKMLYAHISASAPSLVSRSQKKLLHTSDTQTQMRLKNACCSPAPRAALIQ